MSDQPTSARLSNQPRRHPHTPDLVGLRFGSLLVLALGDVQSRRRLWLCRCDCGTQLQVAGRHLVRDASKSCGCGRLVHGLFVGFSKRQYKKKPKEYRAWCSMKARCYNQADTHYIDYGGRGITVCERWRHSYQAFIGDVGLSPSAKHSLDRIDNDGGYWCGQPECPTCGPLDCPKNVRWATASEQRVNRRRSVCLQRYSDDDLFRELRRRGFEATSGGNVWALRVNSGEGEP